MCRTCYNNERKEEAKMVGKGLCVSANHFVEISELKNQFGEDTTTCKICRSKGSNNHQGSKNNIALSSQLEFKNEESAFEYIEKQEFYKGKSILIN